MPNSEVHPSTNPGTQYYEHENSRSENWRNLVESCLGGQLMPFLGAGMSYKARLEGDDLPIGCRGGNMLTTPELIRTILLSVIRKLKSTPSTDWRHRELTRIIGCSNRSFADAAQLHFDVSEKEIDLYQPDAALDLRLFRAIAATPAHRRIAWLVREGLFSEVITTNYDCALEKAYRESFGQRAHTPDVVEPVTCHDSYRRVAHLNRTLTEFGSTPLLRIYKINGCAKCHPHDKIPASFIVITDRHLQEFGQRQWANDLFRDRFRSRTMVFSGFGADEPQIRFTALKVVEEFNQSPASARLKSHCYLHVFGDDLTAPQLQIAKAAGPIRDNVSDPKGAAFTGRDKLHFGHKPSDPGLSSEKFWGRLYTDVTPRLISRRLRRCLPYYWLREHDHRLPASSKEAIALDQRLRGTNQYASDWLSSLLAGDETPFLMQLALRVRSTSASNPHGMRGYYEPFDRVDSLPMQLLYLFHLLDLSAEDVVLGLNDQGFWLQLPINPSFIDSHISARRWILVTENRPARLPRPPEIGSRVACCLSLRKDAHSRQSRLPKSSDGVAITWRSLTFIDLIRLAQHESPTLSTSKRFRHALLHGDCAHRKPSFYSKLVAA